MLSDLVLTGAYMLTRRIWLVWGSHDGTHWLTGGTLGIEGSDVASRLAVAVGLIFLWTAAAGRTSKSSRMRR